MVPQKTKLNRYALYTCNNLLRFLKVVGRSDNLYVRLTHLSPLRIGMPHLQHQSAQPAPIVNTHTPPETHECHHHLHRLRPPHYRSVRWRYQWSASRITNYPGSCCSWRDAGMCVDLALANQKCANSNGLNPKQNSMTTHTIHRMTILICSSVFIAFPYIIHANNYNFQ